MFFLLGSCCCRASFNIHVFVYVYVCVCVCVHVRRMTACGHSWRWSAHPPVAIPPLAPFIQFKARPAQEHTAQTTPVTIPCCLKWQTNIWLFVMVAASQRLLVEEPSFHTFYVNLAERTRKCRNICWAGCRTTLRRPPDAWWRCKVLAMRNIIYTIK